MTYYPFLLLQCTANGHVVHYHNNYLVTIMLNPKHYLYPNGEKIMRMISYYNRLTISKLESWAKRKGYYIPYAKKLSVATCVSGSKPVTYIKEII
jgi:hypothetical protein